MNPIKIEELQETQFKQVFVKVGRKVQLDLLIEKPFFHIVNLASLGFDYSSLIKLILEDRKIIMETGRPDKTYYEVLKILKYSNSINYSLFILIDYNGEELLIPYFLVLNDLEVAKRDRIRTMVNCGSLPRTY